MKPSGGCNTPRSGLDYGGSAPETLAEQW